MPETQVWFLGWEDPLEKGMATHSSILAYRIPWTEEPGGLQSMGLQKAGHDWVTNTFTLSSSYLSPVCWKEYFWSTVLPLLLCKDWLTIFMWVYLCGSVYEHSLFYSTDLSFLSTIFCCCFWLCHRACGILVPWPRVKTTPPEVHTQSLKPLAHPWSPTTLLIMATLQLAWREVVWICSFPSIIALAVLSLLSLHVNFRISLTKSTK